MADDEFAGTEATVYKAPKQATLDEMKTKDADDEALNRWKASLLKNGTFMGAGKWGRIRQERERAQGEGRGRKPAGCGACMRYHYRGVACWNPA